MDESVSTAETRLSRVIFEYAGLIGRQQDREALIRVIGDMGRDLVRADRCTIWLVDESASQLVARFAHGNCLVPISVNQGFVGCCVATGEPILANTPSSDPRFSPAVDRETGYTTANVLTVPMRSADGRVIGAFQAINKLGGFVHSDTNLLALAAEYSARTIETQLLLRQAEATRRVTRELEIAREVQQCLLASAHRHQIPGVEFAGVCRPAAGVGGDYYDLLPLPNGEVAVAIGDISGKGIAAALMMASVQATLHALVLQRQYTPADLVTRMNALVIEAATGQYSTLFFALLDRTRGVLTTTNCGHVYPVVIHGDGARELTIGGPPIGLLPEVAYEQEEFGFEPGDALVCFSDGLTEAENTAGQLWGECGFSDVVLRADGGSASEVVTRIMNAADGFAGAAVARDDMTLLCLRTTA